MYIGVDLGSTNIKAALYDETMNLLASRSLPVEYIREGGVVEFDAEVYCAEINFNQLFELRLSEPTYIPLPKYPSVWRDLAVVCDEAMTVAEVEDVMTAAAGKLLRSIRLFDIYRGTGIPEGKKSVAFSLELRADDRTLTDTDSEGVVTKVLNALKEKLGVELR